MKICYANTIFDFKLGQATMTVEYNPYQSPQNYDVAEDDVDYEYAGFWIRVLASIIDSLVLMLVIVPLVVVAGMMGLIDLDAQYTWLDIVVQIFSVVFYIGCWVKFAGTPGKRILKLKILDADTGEHLTTGKAIIRYVGYIISSLVLLLGLIWVAFDKKKQGWHDKMANSVVVKEL